MRNDTRARLFSQSGNRALLAILATVALIAYLFMNHLVLEVVLRNFSGRGVHKSVIYLLWIGCGFAVFAALLLTARLPGLSILLLMSFLQKSLSERSRLARLAAQGDVFVDQSYFCGLLRPQSSFCPRNGDTSPSTAWWRCPDASCRGYVSKRNNWSAVSPRRPNMRWLITLVWPLTQTCLPPNSSLSRAFARSAWLRSL